MGAKSTPKVACVCPQCGADFFRHPYYVAAHTKLFCGAKCYADWRRHGYVNARGYKWIWLNNENRAVHRMVMEEHLGRKLLPHEDVHHKNEDKTDNRIDNLEVMDHLAHSMAHNPLRWSVEEAVALRKQGLSLRQVADRVGVSRTNLKRGLARYGSL